MPNMLFGLIGNAGTPADEKVVRSTATPVDNTAPAAVQDHVPDFNEKPDTDDNPNLGIVNRQLASLWVEGQQYPPFWGDEVAEQADHNLLIDRQVSTSGTAAAREAAGQFGHGTASYAVGIEPTSDLREGGKLGNDYFSAGKPDIQETAGNYMTAPPGYDQATAAAAAYSGKGAARDSGNSAFDGAYDKYWASFR